MSVCKKYRKEHVVQTVNKKINALHELKNGVSKSDIAKQLNVHVRTVRRWQKNEKKIFKIECNADDRMLKKLKRNEKPKFNIIDELIWLWFNESRNAGVTVNGPQICMQARAMYIALGGSENEFKASNGWLDKFKRRHNILSMDTVGKKGSSNVDAAENFITWFENYIQEENLCEHQIFNCHETGLNFKNMPRKTFILKQETSTSDCKEMKERITIMASSNASGELKIPLVVIGRSTEPRCMKNIAKLPVYYKSQECAWMVSSLFKEWFFSEFVPKVTLYLKSKKLSIKAVLLVDNCSSHPQKLQIGTNIKVIFLPPNTSALIQPMDQGVLQYLKLKYRFFMMEHIISNVNNGGELMEVVEQISLENAIEWLNNAWDDVRPIMIKKSWNSLWPSNCDAKTMQNPVLDLMNSSEKKMIPRVFHSILQNTESYAQISFDSLLDWLNPPTILTPEEALSNEEMMRIIAEEEREKENDSDNDSDPSISNEDVSDYLKEVLAYCKKHPDHFSKDEISVLLRINMRILNKTEHIVTQQLT
ncbi:hypothetical protein PV328_007880 [Microctonus aethiopoides]|uniref:HTH CENPB-type domain-containing protein n=1 Tax=Microctonus aethiopoides TaxID=144406 RepID=A0AA39EZ97_9HYME|nr:hypothetical protein PV328_007880 [Microctonus aethiopoides]